MVGIRHQASNARRMRLLDKTKGESDMEKEQETGTRQEMSSMASATVRLAFRPFARLRGLMARRHFDGMLVLAPCRDIHTVGVSSPIDVAFLDERGSVLEAHRAVGPFRRLSNRRAVCVVERFSQCGTPWFREGERVVLSVIAPVCGEGSERL